MCRGLLYLGEPINNHELLFSPDNALIKQTYEPRFMRGTLNLAGCGMATWSAGLEIPDEPLIYKSTQLPFYDNNFISLCEKLKSTCLMAHIRARYLEDTSLAISLENCHPFKTPNSKILMCHNGALVGLAESKQDYIAHIKPEIFSQIRGTTDSELLYAMLLSCFENNKRTVTNIKEAILSLIDKIRFIRKKNNTHNASSMNLFLSDGNKVMALRYVFDYGHFNPRTRSTQFDYSSLWYTYGGGYTGVEGDFKMKGNSKKTSIIIASEPLTLDTTTWMEMPEYSILAAERQKDNSLKISRFWVDN